jgi:putative transposase
VGAASSAGCSQWNLRRRRSGDKLHLDEVALKINGCRHWLWRAVDQRGLVLDIAGAEQARSARG